MSMAKSDYNILDAYVRAVLKRHAAGDSNLAEAHGDLMHPLTAWDIGNAQEFIPYMKMQLEAWGEPLA